MTDNPPFRQTISRSDFEAKVGHEVGLSRWFEIGQDRINAFADVTEDHQFIHLDPERAAQTIFGGTVAHGYLTLSMLAAMAYDAFPALDGMTASVNYGFDKLRFVSPVRSGSRIRARFVLTGLDELREDRLMANVGVTVEIEGSDKPALTANWRVMYLL